MARRLETLGPREEVCLGCSRQRAPSVLKGNTESQSDQARVTTARLARASFRFRIVREVICYLLEC